MYHLYTSLIEAAGTVNAVPPPHSIYSDWRPYAFLAYLFTCVGTGIRIGRGKESRARIAAGRLRRSALFSQLPEQLSGQDDRPGSPGAPKT